MTISPWTNRPLCSPLPMIDLVSWEAPNSQVPQRNEEVSERWRMKRKGKQRSQSSVFPRQDQVFLSPDSLLQKPWKVLSQATLSLPPGAVTRPGPTHRVLLSIGKVVSWKFLPLPCPIPVNSVPRS